MERKNAIVYCQGGFRTTNGKTAHGLIRYSARFRICAVIDSTLNGKDSGTILDGIANGIPIVSDLTDALIHATRTGLQVDSYIIGLAPDGGRLPADAIDAVKEAIKSRLDIYSGLHDYLGDQEELVALAHKSGSRIYDIRKPKSTKELHFFSGIIDQVGSLRVAVLGTDSAVGKRTTAWKLVNSLREKGIRTELIGTGQTAWLQGARYSIILDSIVNDFVSGEIEHVIHQAWMEERPQVMVLEGQGSLLNPAYPGGFELLAAGRPDMVILQHVPKRKTYDGFPGFEIHPLKKQIEAVELISGKRVSAITINHEGMSIPEIFSGIEKISHETGLPVFDVVEFGAADLAKFIQAKLKYEFSGS